LGLPLFVSVHIAALFLFHRKHLKLYFSQARTLFSRQDGQQSLAKEEP